MIVMFLTLLHDFCWLLLVHLSYHILAHRIQILREYLSEEMTEQSSNGWKYFLFSLFDISVYFFFLMLHWVSYRQSQDITQKLKTIQNVFNDLCRSADQLNSFNSVVVFVYFTTKTINLIIAAYMICYFYFIEKNDPMVKMLLISVFVEIIYFIFIFNAADSPVNEVSSLKLF